MLDLESDLEELQESEHRWAAKHKRTIEQVNSLKTRSAANADLVLVTDSSLCLASD